MPLGQTHFPSIVSNIGITQTIENTNIPIAMRDEVGYRYGFNGMERDDESKGSGNSYTTLFRQYDPRLGRWLSPDPITHYWQSPYLAMGNNPVVFNDPLGDKIRGTREEKRAFKRQSKADGTWGGKNGFRRKYRGSKRNLVLHSTDKVGESMATAEPSATPLNSNKDISPNTDWLHYNPGGDNTDGAAAENTTIDPMPTRPGTVPRPDITPPMLRSRPMLSLPIPPAASFSVTSPFVGGQSAFTNPTLGNQELQKIADAYLNNSSLSQIIITIGTSTVNLKQNSTNPDKRSVEQLLWDRGRAMQNILRTMGVPVGAFPTSNWLQFAPGKTIGTIIKVK